MRNMNPLPKSTILLTLMSCVLTLLFLAPVVSADISFGPQGSGAGQLEGAPGAAVDHSTGNVYVADEQNGRIAVFDSSGGFVKAIGWGVADGTSAELQTCTTTCFKGIKGSGSGQFEAPISVAIDNNPVSSAYRNLYVLEGSSHRVQRFNPAGEFVLMFGDKVNKTTGGDTCTAASGDLCGVGVGGGAEGAINSRFDDPIAVGPSGIVYVGDTRQVEGLPFESFIGRIEKFDPSGAFINQQILFEEQNRVVLSVAVDSTNSLYVAIDRDDKGIYKFDSGGTELYSLEKDVFTRSLAVDLADHLLVGQMTSKAKGTGGWPSIAEYDSSGGILRRFGYRALPLGPARGIAPFHTATGDVFITGNVETGEGQVRYIMNPPPGPVAVPGSVEASPIRSTKATFNAEVNPEGKVTTYHFDYVDQKGFEESGFTGPTVKHTPEEALGSDFELHLATEDVVVVPDTNYHFRLVATNADGSQTIEGEEFKTLPPVQFGATWATDVGTDAATMHVEVNPLESQAIGYFEYVDDVTYQESGFNEASQAPNVAGGAAALDFGSGTEAVAKSAALYPIEAGTTYHYRLKAENPFVTITGPERTFTTLASLTPNTSCPNQAFRAAFSSPLPDCRAYEMVSPLDKNNGDIAVLGETLTSLPATVYQSSVAGGKLTFGSVRAFGDAQSAPYASQYLSTRGPDGWSTEPISPPRTTATIHTTGLTDTEFKLFSPDLCSTWLRSQADPPLAPGALEGYLNLYRRDFCGEEGYEALTTATPPHVLPYPAGSPDYTSLELQGVSADGTETVYVTEDNLTPEAPSNTDERLQVYHHSAGGQLRFVCMLPNGKASKEFCTAGGFGNPVFSGLGRNRFGNIQNAISDDGSRVYWTDDGKGPGRIYLRLNAGQEQSKVAAGKCTEPEKACTVKVSETISAEPSRFWAAAADGSKAIFTTNEKNGRSELYEFASAEAKSTLIAKGVQGVLGVGEDATRVYFASAEVLDTGAVGGKPNLYFYEEGGGVRFIGVLAAADADSTAAAISSLPRDRRSRVSPDGLHAAFVSRAPLTGYDNTDANSGKADIEVYIYDAAGEELHCASCNPSGARPVGANIGAEAAPIWAAGSIPVWQNQFHPTRVLSDDGTRVYFISIDALVAADTNGVQDVYQWEAPGSGDCEESSPAFSEENDGCVSLISTGQSPRESTFIDASPSGDNVFFATLSSLLPQDYGLVDIYDARAGGGYPPEPSAPAACEGEACQGPYVPPEDPTPASSAFEGAGNVVEGAKPGRCTKGKVRRKGRCVAKQPKRATKHKRAKHERRAGR